jgi:hypothetical protein
MEITSAVASGGKNAVKVKIPSAKSQIPNKHQYPKYRYPNNKILALDIGIWRLFGIWILGFGILDRDDRID